MKQTRRLERVAIILVVIVGAGLLGFMGGFHTATGSFPFNAQSIPIVPPADVAVGTVTEAEQAIEPLQDKTYEAGYNCLDYAWDAMRMLHWQGQTAMVARLDLEPDPDHAVLIVPTSDKGWVFLEPQTGKQIYPTAGGMYMDFTRIEGVYVMTLGWTLIDTFLLSIDEGVVDNSALSYYAGQGRYYSLWQYWQR